MYVSAGGELLNYLLKDLWITSWFNCFVASCGTEIKKLFNQLGGSAPFTGVTYRFTAHYMLYHKYRLEKWITHRSAGVNVLMTGEQASLWLDSAEGPHHSFGPILLSKTRTEPSPRPATISDRWESQDRLVTQLSAPVGMSWKTQAEIFLWGFKRVQIR